MELARTARMDMQAEIDALKAQVAAGSSASDAETREAHDSVAVMEEQLDGAPTHIFYIDEKVPRSP